MKYTIETLENVIDGIQAQISTTHNQDKVAMLKRAKDEAMILLGTLTYINQ